MITNLNLALGKNNVTIAEFLKREANSRANGRIKNIDVQVSGTNGDTTILLTGQSQTYYAKQLAQQPIIEYQDQLPEMLGIEHFPRVINDIEIR